jgi:tellurite resistance protein TehA-like permease
MEASQANVQRHQEGIRLRPVALWPHLAARIQVMHPAYFALVMATGIVAVGCHLHGLNELAWFLARINILMYLVLWILFFVRLTLFPQQVWADCTSHQRAPGFFTFVAATSVLGSQTVLLHANPGIATGLWWLSLALWALSTYGVFSILVTREKKPALSEGINGGWLVAVVATQSVVVLGCTVGRPLFGDPDTSLYVLLSFWLCGGMLYFWIISLIFYRYLFFQFSPDDLMPPYWINMGAVAISTLAGALLARAADDSALLGPMLPFITGLTVMFWATATWWIPMLLVLGVWRHYVRRFPITYDPLYWGLVFPMGMYAVCTFQLGNVLKAPFLFSIAGFFVIAATVSWLLTFMGMVRRLVFVVVLGYRHLRSTPHGIELPSTDEDEEAQTNEYRLLPKQG